MGLLPSHVQILSILALNLVAICSCETHYSVLGISKNAKPPEIKRAYRKLAHQWHPDKNKDEKAIDMMSKINRAYEILYDEDKRRHYDLLEYDDDYAASGGSDNAYSSNTDSEYDSFTDGEPTDEINTKQFMDDVLPATITTPYLIYFFHDFCELCKDWTEALEAMRKDFEAIGVKMASVNVIVSSNAAAHCGIYIHEVPKLTVIIDKASYVFKDEELSFESVKRFIYNQLPSYTIKRFIEASEILSLKSRIADNKPTVLLVSQRPIPSFNFKVLSFAYKAYLTFYYSSTLGSLMAEMNSEALKQLNIREGEKFLRIYSDFPEPVVTLKGDQLNRESTVVALNKNKFLILPNVNSCLVFDEICPIGADSSWCALLVINSKNGNMSENFRLLASKWRDNKKLNLGTLNRRQNSMLKYELDWSGIIIDIQCDDEIASQPILLLHRSTKYNLEFHWFTGYCGTPENHSNLLQLVESNRRLSQSVTLPDPCLFQPYIDDDGDHIKPHVDDRIKPHEDDRIKPKGDHSVDKFNTTTSENKREKYSEHEFGIVIASTILMLAIILFFIQMSSDTKEHPFVFKESYTIHRSVQTRNAGTQTEDEWSDDDDQSTLPEHHPYYNVGTERFTETVSIPYSKY